jgi:DNA-binding GntR family transcriptional regulator
VGYNAWSLPQRIEQSILEHRAILRAIEERNRARLEKLVVKHITFSKRSYQAQLKGLNQRAGDAKRPVPGIMREKIRPGKSKVRP